MSTTQAVTINRLCWQILAIALVLFALVVSLIRGLLPHIPEVRTELIHYLESEYQLHVQMDKLSAEWQAFGPALTVNNLVLPPQDNLPITVISENVHIKLDFWQSLFTLSPQIETVVFDGVKVALNLDELAASDDQATVGDKANLDWLYGLLLEQLGHFSITDASLQLVSKQHAYQPIFIDNLLWQNTANRHQAQGIIHVDQLKSEQEQLTLRIDLTGDGYQPDTVAGQLYVTADSLDLGEWASRQHTAQTNTDNIEFQGVINLDAWMTFAHRQIRDGILVFKPSWLQWHDADTQQKFAINSGSLLWTLQPDGWKIDSHDLDLSTNDQTWPSLTLAIGTREGDFFGYANQIIPANLTPMLPLVPDLGKQQVNIWQQLNPQGLIGPIRLYKPDDKPLIAKVELQQLQWQPYLSVPGISPIDAQLTWANNQLEFALPEQEYTLDFSGDFGQPIVLRGSPIMGRYNVEQQRLTVPNIEFINDDIALQAGLNLEFAQQTHMGLAAHVTINDVSHLGRYFPLMAMSPNLINYLNDGLVAGNINDAQVVWHGALGDYPYQDSSGVFQAGFTLDSGIFKFQPNWPAVSSLTLSALFENDMMDLHIDQGKLDNVVVDGARVSIPHLGKESLLRVEADITTDAQAATKVINASSLRGSVGATLDVVQIQRNINTTLDLSIPLYKGGEQLIKGQVTLDNNPVFINSPGLDLQAVSGQVSFVNQLIEGKNIKARLFQQPLTFSVKTGKHNSNLALNVDMRGKWDLDALPASLHNPMTETYHGLLDWNGGLTMIFDPSGYSLQVSANSDLIGTSLDLPMPYQKSADEPRKLSADLIGDNKQSSLSIKLGNDLEFWGGFNADSGSQLAYYDVMIGRHFRLGDNLNKQQGHLHLDLPKVDLAQWLPLINRFSATAEPEVITSSVRDRILTAAELPGATAQHNATSPIEATAPAFPKLVGIHANIAQLNVLGQSFDKLHFDAQPTEHVWRVDADSQQFAGRIDFYPNWRDQGIKVVAKKLHLFPVVSGPETVELAPTSMLEHLPTLAVDVDDFSVNDLSLGHLVLQGLPHKQGYQFQTISITKPTVALQANGLWSVENGTDKTLFEVNLQADKFDDLSTMLKINPGLQDAPLDLSGQLSWQGAPYHFALDTLNGQLKFDLGKGHLSEISDKGARVFSLFSLDSLLRKLSLDFSDVFGEGLYFNTFNGNLTIDNGVVKTTDSEMDAIAGNMRVRGYTDLTTQSLNYDIRFVPQLASSVPTVVLLSTSAWTLGLGAFALTKVLEPVIEVISEIRFRVTGTMDNPQLEELERKSKEIEIPKAILPQADETSVETTIGTKAKANLDTTANVETKANIDSKAENNVEADVQRGDNAREAEDKSLPRSSPSTQLMPGIDSLSDVNQPSATDTEVDRMRKTLAEPATNVVMLPGVRNANQLITMSKQSRCQSQSRVCRLAA
ncbi:TIGR02099 family protein [Shewanella sp. BF02_Schw]|uniref:YhdP family protein n=1 Tax=Shewanella sp. BF02_Schw TaxID=394908 RepID=UPI0017812BD6|nr:TIGR02099 family protein [Shewanella sp. BF02_Schw]